MPAFVVAALREHLKSFPVGPHGEVFTSPSEGPLYRGTFRAYTWRRTLVRAGLLGDVTEFEPGRWRGMWEDSEDTTHVAEFDSEPKAVAHVARQCAGPCPRFHDLRHSFATWLVSNRVPINDVAKVLGHESITTTLNRYAHVLPRTDERVLGAFAEFSRRMTL